MGTVLVIEHHPANLIAQAMLLRSVGYAVLEAEDDRDAARACQEHAGPIRLLVIGTTAAPGRDRELAGLLQSLRPEMRVLFLSSFSVMPRPVGPDVLVRTIRERLSGDPHVLTAASGAPE
jgi:response regulator RpfG family c-di-GMP phosphodiesterase